MIARVSAARSILDSPEMRPFFYKWARFVAITTGQDERHDIGGARGPEGIGACLEGRSGGPHVVDQHDTQACEREARLASKGTRDVIGAGITIERRLRRRLAKPHDGARRARDTEPSCDGRGEQRRLIVAAGDKALRMQRHGDDEMRRALRTREEAITRDVGHEVTEPREEIGAARIFGTNDRGGHRTSIREEGVLVRWLLSGREHRHTARAAEEDARRNALFACRAAQRRDELGGDVTESAKDETRESREGHGSLVGRGRAELRARRAISSRVGRIRSGAAPAYGHVLFAGASEENVVLPFASDLKVSLGVALTAEGELLDDPQALVVTRHDRCLNAV